MDYKTSGVDIEAGKIFVDKIKGFVCSTHNKGVLSGYGGFNGMIEVPKKYENPVIVSGTDGVGTKINLVSHQSNTGDLSVYYGIGIDLVAMCVNDVITCGAEPLYFLDYISTPMLKLNKLEQIILGIVDGCKISGCSLLGGETAEHPPINNLHSLPSEDDLAGFCTGVVEKKEIVDGRMIREGDIVIGIESSGLHSNGFSLVNNLLFDQKLFSEDIPELITPTRIYAPLVRNLLKEFPILGMSHITGGGIPENLPRCLPKQFKVDVDYTAWTIPEIFTKIMLAGEISEEEMKNVFNLGVGYCLVIPEEVLVDVQYMIYGHNMKSFVIGEVTK